MGTIFKIDPIGPPEGIQPSELMMCGNTLYGTTAGLGEFAEGTIFSVSTNGSGFQSLSSFSLANNYESPESGLILFGGIFYGTTQYGGTGFGTVFGFNTNNNQFILIHQFSGPQAGDGENPSGPLLLFSNTLYGVTSGGGAGGCGTVYEINQFGGNDSDTILHNFAGRYAMGDGSTPMNNYGTSFDDLYDFSGGSDGTKPLCGLTLPVVDNLESIWSLDTTINASSENISNALYSIAIDNNVVLFVNNTFVTNIYNGETTWGPLLSLSNYLHQGDNDIRLIIAGDDDANDYFAMAIQSVSPNVAYGTTQSGGEYNFGTIYGIDFEGDESILYNFSDGLDGEYPIGDLVFTNNRLYGVTYGHPGTQNGTIFSFTTTNTVLQTLHAFGGSDGANPAPGLVLYGNTLYGTTTVGGTSGQGTVFSYNLANSNFEVLHLFLGNGANDGANPSAGLTLSNNILYGTTYYGGSANQGTIFSIGINGEYTNLLSLGTSDSDYGQEPRANLKVQNNLLYGTTSSGGAYDYGMIFGINTNGADFTDVYDFTYDIFYDLYGYEIDGEQPEGGLCFP